MRVFVCPSRDEIGKFQGLVCAFPDIWYGLVLDIGCRSENLKYVLANREIHYYGLDLYPPADIVGNLEMGLPFEDASFDTVVALDVLEHTDNIYKACNELCRVARNYVLITLPNAYEVKSRLTFLFGRGLSAKYGLPLDPPDDRHRWLFSFQEARTFTHTMAQRHGFEVRVEGCLIGPHRAFAGGRLIASRLPNLLSPWYVSLLRRIAVE